MRPLLSALVLIVAVIVSTGGAQAATCNASVSDMSFGAVSLRSGAVNRTSGTLEVTCTGAVVAAVGVCVRFGAGGGGAGTGNSPRYMRNGAGDTLAYQLRPYGHGSLYGELDEVFVSVPVSLGEGSVTVPIFGEILSAGTEVDPGQYDSVFSGTSDIELSQGILSCDLFEESRAVPDFRVAAEVVDSCQLVVGALDFGNIGSVASNPADASATVDVSCTSGTNYTISLGLGGGQGVTNPAQRIMRSLTNALYYGLYKDPGRSQIWGMAPSEMVAATGSGFGQRFQVYGRIHSGQIAPVGFYTDSVVVTVSY